VQPFFTNPLSIHELNGSLDDARAVGEDTSYNLCFVRADMCFVSGDFFWLLVITGSPVWCL
jgi:hypothetical protein